jgi:hypothetical protein
MEEKFPEIEGAGTLLFMILDAIIGAIVIIR